MVKNPEVKKLDDWETKLKARRVTLAAEQQRAINLFQTAQRQVIDMQTLIAQFDGALSIIDEMLGPGDVAAAQPVDQPAAPLPEE